MSRLQPKQILILSIAVLCFALAALLFGGFGVPLGEAHDCTVSRYDVNCDGIVNVLDVQLVVNAYLAGEY